MIHRSRLERGKAGMATVALCTGGDVRGWLAQRRNTVVTA